MKEFPEIKIDENELLFKNIKLQAKTLLNSLKANQGA